MRPVNNAAAPHRGVIRPSKRPRSAVDEAGSTTGPSANAGTKVPRPWPKSLAAAPPAQQQNNGDLATGEVAGTTQESWVGPAKPTPKHKTRPISAAAATLDAHRHPREGPTADRTQDSCDRNNTGKGSAWRPSGVPRLRGSICSEYEREAPEDMACDNDDEQPQPKSQQLDTFFLRQKTCVAKEMKTRAAKTEDDICWDYRAGGCKRGGKCRYLHLSDDVAKLADARLVETKGEALSRTGDMAKAAAARVAKLEEGRVMPRDVQSEAEKRLEDMFVESGLRTGVASGSMARDTAAATVVRAETDGWLPCTSFSTAPAGNGRAAIKVVVVSVAMRDMSLDDAGMLEWALWMDGRFMQSVAEHYGCCRFEAHNVDFSCNQLTVAGVRVLCALLEKHNVPCHMVKLDQNLLGDAALAEIARYLTVFHAAPTRTLHVRDNRFTAKGVSWLLCCIAMHPAYPIWTDKVGRYLPLCVHIGNQDGEEWQAEAILPVLADVTERCSIAVICSPEARSNSNANGSVVAALEAGQKHNCVVELRDNILARHWPESLPSVAPYAQPMFADIDQVITDPGHGRSEPYVLFEDSHIAVLYKPPGWLCHSHGVDPLSASMAADDKQTRVERLLDEKEPSPIGEWILLSFGSDPKWAAVRGKQTNHGLCHRLDVHTSGPVLVGKSMIGYTTLVQSIQDRHVGKDYLALVHGSMITHFQKETGVIDARIDRSKYPPCVRIHESGDPALTLWEVIAEYESAEDPDEKYTLVHLRIITGRTHQIRVHLAHVGHPIVSDWHYNYDAEEIKRDEAMCPRIFLHKFRVCYVDMQGRATSVYCSLQHAPELWQVLQQLRLVGGMAARGCSAPGLAADSPSDQLSVSDAAEEEQQLSFERTGDLGLDVPMRGSVLGAVAMGKLRAKARPKKKGCLPRRGREMALALPLSRRRAA